MQTTTPAPTVVLTTSPPGQPDVRRPAYVAIDETAITARVMLGRRDLEQAIRAKSTQVAALAERNDLIGGYAALGELEALRERLAALEWAYGGEPGTSAVTAGSERRVSRRLLAEREVGA